LESNEKLDDGLSTVWLEITEQLRSIPLYNLPGMTKVKARSVEYRMACLRDTSAKVYATAVYLKQSSIEFYYITLISIFKDQAGPIKNNSP